MTYAKKTVCPFGVKEISCCMCKNKLGTISVTSKIANQSKLSTTIYKDLKQAKLKILKRGDFGWVRAMAVGLLF